MKAEKGSLCSSSRLLSQELWEFMVNYLDFTQVQFFLSFKDYFYFMSKFCLHVYLSVYHVNSVPTRPEKGAGSRGTGVTDGS